MSNLSSVESIFLAALEKKSPEERAAYLDQACAGDEGLRRRVERLLDAHPKVGGFLEQPAVAAATQPSAEAPAQEAATLPPRPIAEGPGSRIGPYKLLQQIGEGGMGVVYMAEQEKPVHRRVALKIIKPGMDSDVVIARFEAERQALAMMDHLNIARVLDAGTTETGRPYFVMELVNGVSLTRYCDENKLTPRERLELLIPVCQAIQHAHQKGIIHRDIKPSNVLVTLYDGKPVPKVIDFGVAKAIEQRLTERTMFTQYGAIIGTLEYMSPEQAEMSGLGVDTRSDIYSLGVLAYELLTGTTPLERQQVRELAYAELVRRIKEEEPPRPSTRLSRSGEALATISAQRRTEPAQLAKLVRGELDWIVMRCLEKDRTRRYETAGALARDVQHYLDDEAVEACPPSLPYRLGKFWRRNKGPVLAAALVLLALLGGIVGTTWQAVRADKAKQLAEAKEEEAVAEKAKALAAAEEEQRAKLDALKAQHAEAEARKNAEQDRDAKERALATAEGLRLTAQSSAELHSDPGLGLLLAIEGAKRIRGLEANNALLAALDHCQEERTLIGHTGDVLSAKFTPDGKRIMSCAKDGTVRFWDVPSGQQLFATPTPWPYGGPQMAGAVQSPDGKYFVTLYWGLGWIVDSRNNKRFTYTDRVVRLWEAATGKQLAVLRGHTDRVITAAFSGDSRRLVTASDDTTVRVWAIPSGKQLAVLRGHTSSAQFSPDGRKVLTVSSDHSVHEDLPAAWLGRVTTEELDPWDIRVPAAEKSSGGISVAGSWKSNDDREKVLARVWDAGTGKELQSLKRPTTLLGDLLGAQTPLPSFGKFSPNGQRVVIGLPPTTGLSEVAEIWDVAAGKMLAAVKHGGMSGKDHFAWSPDGKRLATIRGDYASVWDPQSGQELTTLRGHEQTLLSISFSGDGKLVLTASGDRTARVWDTATGEQVAVLKGHRSPVNTADLSPDGQRVVTAAADGTVRLWRRNPPTDHALPFAEPVVNLNTIAFSPDGRTIATGGNDYLHPSPRIWDTASGKPLHKLQAPRDPAFGGPRPPPPPPRPPLATAPGIREKLPDPYEVLGVTYSPDGRRLLTIAREEKIRIRRTTLFGLVPSNEDLPYTPARIWDVETGAQLLALRAGEFSLSCAYFSPDGRKVLTAESDFKPYYAVYSDTGGTIFSQGLSSAPGKPTFARLYDAASGKELLKLPHNGRIIRAVFSPDGRRIVTSSDPGRWPSLSVYLWDAENGKMLFGLEGHDSNTVASFSPDGKKIAVFASGIRIHHAESGKLLAKFEGSAGNPVIRQLTHADAGVSPFSPDGKTLLALGKDGLALLDVETGKQLVAFRGISALLNSALFSTDGRFVVTASNDQTARVWNAATGKELYTLRHKDSVRLAVMSPDSRHVATASDTVRIWQLDLLPIATRHKPRELSPEEKDRFAIR